MKAETEKARIASYGASQGVTRLTTSVSSHESGWLRRTKTGYKSPQSLAKASSERLVACCAVSSFLSPCKPQSRSSHLLLATQRTPAASIRSDSRVACCCKAAVCWWVHFYVYIHICMQLCYFAMLLTNARSLWMRINVHLNVLAKFGDVSMRRLMRIRRFTCRLLLRQ